MRKGRKHKRRSIADGREKYFCAVHKIPYNSFCIGCRRQERQAMTDEKIPDEIWIGKSKQGSSFAFDGPVTNPDLVRPGDISYTRTESAQEEITRLNEGMHKLSRENQRLFEENMKLKSGPFICGHGEIVNGVNRTLQVCQAFGSERVDTYYLRKAEEIEGDDIGQMVEALQECYEQLLVMAKDKIENPWLKQAREALGNEAARAYLEMRRK